MVYLMKLIKEYLGGGVGLSGLLASHGEAKKKKKSKSKEYCGYDRIKGEPSKKVPFICKFYFVALLVFLVW